MIISDGTGFRNGDKREINYGFVEKQLNKLPCNIKRDVT
jgi:hypothetical protein